MVKAAKTGGVLLDGLSWSLSITLQLCWGFLSFSMVDYPWSDYVKEL